MECVKATSNAVFLCLLSGIDLPLDKVFLDFFLRLVFGNALLLGSLFGQNRNGCIVPVSTYTYQLLSQSTTRQQLLRLWTHSFLNQTYLSVPEIIQVDIQQVGKAST